MKAKVLHSLFSLRTLYQEMMIIMIIVIINQICNKITCILCSDVLPALHQLVSFSLLKQLSLYYPNVLKGIFAHQQSRINSSPQTTTIQCFLSTNHFICYIQGYISQMREHKNVRFYPRKKNLYKNVYTLTGCNVKSLITDYSYWPWLSKCYPFRCPVKRRFS